MVLVRVIAFAVLKILHNLLSIQKSLFTNNCRSKIRKSAQHDLTFIFIKLSGKRSSFVKIRLVLERKNVASFIKTSFYLKGDCTKMREHAETFHANMGCKMAHFYASFPVFKKEIKGAIFKRYLHENMSFHTPTFYIPYFHTSLH